MLRLAQSPVASELSQSQPPRLTFTVVMKISRLPGNG